jgi:P-type Cu+ transporter
MAGIQGSQGSQSSQSSQNRDPVCGMQVDPQKAAAQSNYQGQTYSFCSQQCKQKFDQSPQQFAKKTA